MLAYRDLLAAVSLFYDSKDPAIEDRACLLVLAQASDLPRPESAIRQTVATEFGEEAANTALQLVKAYNIVAATGSSTNPLLYAPKVWAGLHAKAPQALASLDITQREVLTHLITKIRDGQGYPETILRAEAAQHGLTSLIDMAIGIGLINKTELRLIDGTKRAFLTLLIYIRTLRMNLVKTCATASKSS